MNDEPAAAPARRHPSSLEGQDALRRRRRHRWFTVGGVLVVVTLLTSLFAFGLTQDPRLIRSPLLGKPAPSFALRTLDGSETVSLTGLHGQVVVINFWASWCADCRIEHSALMAAWDRFRDHRVVMIGVPFQDRSSASLAYLKEMGGDWPQLSDPGGRVALAFGVYGVPETFVIGPDGTVAAKQTGAVAYGWLTDQIERQLSREGP